MFAIINVELAEVFSRVCVCVYVRGLHIMLNICMCFRYTECASKLLCACVGGDELVGLHMRLLIKM